MYKICIFENEMKLVEGAFDMVNILSYNNELEFKVFQASQDGQPFDSLTQFDLIIVDIELSTNSRLDGFNLIQKLIPIVGESKIVIMTGHSKVDEKLNAMGISQLPVLAKPLDFIQLQSMLVRLLPPRVQMSGSA